MTGRGFDTAKSTKTLDNSRVFDFKERKIMLLLRKLKCLIAKIKGQFFIKKKNDDDIDMYPLW